MQLCLYLGWSRWTDDPSTARILGRRKRTMCIVLVGHMSIFLSAFLSWRQSIPPSGILFRLRVSRCLSVYLLVSISVYPEPFYQSTPKLSSFPISNYLSRERLPVVHPHTQGRQQNFLSGRCLQ